MSQIRNQRTQRQSGCHDRSGGLHQYHGLSGIPLGMHAIQAGDPVCLGGDLRPSTDGDKRSILRAVAKAVEDLGLVIRFLGRLPTPALMFDALQANCASIMVTGSHIPFDRNGIKFNKPNGEAYSRPTSLPFFPASTRPDAPICHARGAIAL